ncbi:MAG: hypothetical protein FWD12_04415, partial [Alphaproteobacteria bacterium]|nr:hypothetical protein [Alphaproteobacteria bacterium]
VAALEADMRYTGWRSRLPPEPLAAPLTSGPLPAPMSGSAPAGNVRSAPMSASAPAAHVRSDAPLQSSSVAGSTVGVVARKKPRAKRKNGGNKR